MSVIVQTDAELDRILSVRAASRVPLPPELSMIGAKDASRFFAQQTFYGVMGVADHPLVSYLQHMEIQAAMAATISTVPYLDRLSHFSAWSSIGSPVTIVDATGGSERVVEPAGRRAAGQPSGPPNGGPTV